MSGFLAGLVQRGASLPARAGESALRAAPLAPLQATDPRPLEAIAEVVAAEAPGTAARADPGPPVAHPPAVHEEPSSQPLQQHVVHVTNVTDLPLRTVRETGAVTQAHSAPATAVPLSLVRSATPIPFASQALPAPQLSTHRVDPDAKSADEVTAAAEIRALPDAQTIHIVGQTSVRAELPATAPLSPSVTAAARAAPSDRDLPETRIDAAPIEPPALRSIEAQRVAATGASAPSPILVRIGKVEVRPPASATAPPAPQRASASPLLGFAAYRRLRMYRT